MLDYYDTRKFLIDFLKEMLPEPYEKYISDEEIDEFTREHHNVCVVSGEEGLPVLTSKE